MRHYETLVIIRPTLTESEIEEQIESIKNLINELGGEVKAIKRIGIRKLAYEIDKNPRGYYVVFYHYSPASIIIELERKLRYNENVLRFLTIKYETKKEISKFNEFVAQITGKVEEKAEEKEESKEESKEEDTSKETQVASEENKEEVAQEEGKE